MVIVSKSDLTKFFANLDQSKKTFFPSIFLGHHLPPPEGRSCDEAGDILDLLYFIVSGFIWFHSLLFGFIWLYLVVFGCI